MKNPTKSSLQKRLSLFQKDVFLKYLIIVFAFFFCASILFLSKNSSQFDFRGDSRHNFFEQTEISRLKTRIFFAQFDASLFTILIVFPVLFLSDIAMRKRIKSSFAHFFLIFVSYLLISLAVGQIFSVLWRQVMGRDITNQDIVRLQSVQIFPIDTTNNGVDDTFSVFLTLNGNHPQNRTENGLTAWGGIKICIYPGEAFSKAISCEHFFHAENEEALGQDRLQVGMNGQYTYQFSIETPIESDLQQYKDIKTLHVTADIIGQDARLLFYGIPIPNMIKFQNFENIGIKKLQKEGGLH